MEPLKQSYAFDVLLLSSTLRAPNEDENPYSYSVRLLDEFVDLPEDRLSAKRFSSTPLGEFVASPCDLVGSLSSKGICVNVYENDKILGSGSGRPTASLLRRLADPTFTVEEKINIVLAKNRKKVAEVELNVRFSATDAELDTRLLPFGCYDVCRPLDKSVNPRDLIFTLGRSRHCAGTSCITDERLMSHAGPPFSCMPKKSEPSGGAECSCAVRGVKPPPELDPSKERERKLLKKLLVDLEIDKVRVPTPPSGHEHSRGCKCPRSQSSSVSSSCQSNDYWQDAVGDQLPTTEFEGELTPEQLEEIREMRKRMLGVCPVIKAPSLTTTKYTPPLLCPVCHANITWLPKVAACPYCGYKRFEMEKPSEEPFDETATAADVLRNHVLQSRLDSAGQMAPRSAQSRESKDCSCKSGRICTRCRIQELCDRMLTVSSATKVKSPQAAQTEAQSQSRAQLPEPAGSPKKTASSTSQRRKELVKIFSEMRKEFGGSNSPRTVSKQVQQDCAALAGNSLKKGRRRMPAAIREALKDLDQDLPTIKKHTRSSKSKSKRRKSKRYTFLVRRDRTQPPMSHQTCARGCGRVPCHMGWMWTESELARHRCWRPGSITKPIREIMAYFLTDYPADNIANSRFHYRRRRDGAQEPVTEEPLIQYPTLHITKKHDEYTITLRPLKDPKSLAVAANPYANMKPVVFRISKDPVATGKRNMKMSLMDKGYPVCSCKQPVASCFCRSHIDQKIVAHEVKVLSEKMGWKDVSDTFVFSDLSDSESENELDFGVTPPAGVVKPERLNQPDRVNCETQYNENDWALPTMYPHPPSALVQYAGCVLGERRGRFPWIMGKGYVHREPKPAKKINKPKTQKKSKRLRGGFDGAFLNDNANEPQRIHRPWHKSNSDQSYPFYTHANGLQIA